MRLIRLLLLLSIISVIVLPQTKHLGQGVFYNDQGAINLAVDAGLAMQKWDSPYVPFVLYMGTDQASATVPKEKVFLIYGDNTYTLPDLKVFREEYKQDRQDYRAYNQIYMGQESLVMTHFRDYEFDWDRDFFPPRGSGHIAASQAGINNLIAFKSFVYFKNPGFKKGDQLLIKVVDGKNDEIFGACAVVIQ